MSATLFANQMYASVGALFAGVQLVRCRTVVSSSLTFAAAQSPFRRDGFTACCLRFLFDRAYTVTIVQRVRMQLAECT